MPKQKGKTKLILIGRTSKPHGLKGVIHVVFLNSLDTKNAAKLRHIYLGDEDHCIPYLIETLTITAKKEIYLKTEGCDNRNKAEEISGLKIFIPEEQFEKYFVDEDTIPFNSLIGYHAFDANGKELGKIEDVLELPAHTLAQVFIDEKEALLPLNEETILKIDRRKKIILLQLPDGLLDIF